MKKGLILLAVLGLAVTFGFADEYESFNQSIDNLDDATQKAGGFWLRKVLQYLPVGGLVIGLGIGIYLGKQQANQQQDGMKIALTILGVAVAGTLAGIAVDAFIGAAAFQDAKVALEVARDEWLNAVGKSSK